MTKTFLNFFFLVLSETWLNNETSNDQVISKLQNWSVIKRLDATESKNTWVSCYYIEKDRWKQGPYI